MGKPVEGSPLNSTTFASGLVTSLRCSGADQYPVRITSATHCEPPARAQLASQWFLLKSFVMVPFPSQRCPLFSFRVPAVLL
jgi:hypothetical protein